MSVLLQKTVIVIDAMAFRRAGVESFLAPWAKSENVALISLKPESAHAKLVESDDCNMLIYNVGGAPPFACETLAEVHALHTLCPDAPLAILADDESTVSVISAINSGAQAYVSNSMSPDLVLEALSFVLHGGTYFPPMGILASLESGGTRQSDVSIDGHDGGLRQMQGSLFDERSDFSHPDDGSVGARHTSVHLKISRLTERQLAVLSCLRHGDPNKVIGRKLNMTETTVKLHIREIMRKLGVCNRTQVVIATADYGLHSDSATEHNAQEQSAPFKSPRPLI